MSYENACHKREYESKKDAQTMKNYIEKTGREKFLRIYSCHNHWHLSREGVYKLYQGKTHKQKRYEKTHKSDFNE